MILFLQPFFAFTCAEGESEASESSDTAPCDENAQGSFLNLLPPHLEVTRKQSKTAIRFH